MSKEIEMKVNELLVAANAEMTAVYVGETVKDKWQCDAWRIHFENNAIIRGLAKSIMQSFDYYTGLGHRKAKDKNPYKNFGSDKYYHEQWNSAKLKPVKPSASSVLYSLILDSGASEESFEDWCSNFEHETDSRKAMEIYLACQENSNKLRKVFDRATIETLQKLLQDY